MSPNLSEIENPVQRWVLLTGSRTGITLGLAVCVVAVSAALSVSGVVYVGGGSNLATALSSGLLSGLLTLVTVVLSINQLILSRVFGSPSDLSDTVEGSVAFRERIESLADVPVSPNEPDQFLALVGETIADTADRVVERFEADGAMDPDVETYASRVREFGEHIAGAGETDDQSEVLVLTLGTDYAELMQETRRLQARSGESSAELSDEAGAALADVLELLQAVATMRQFYKTLAIQQDLARLSRRLVYTGLAAVLTTYWLSQVYTASSAMSTTLPGAWMPAVTSVAAGVIFSPLLLLVVSLLRVATVTLYTASVGSFVPPVEDVSME